ncbi:hypothetical protein [Ascidiimonas sp. W6]|uniref:hypothetical protein n=1 Tax=Ascidiimonas meishanensis TaxID=3128903 RepID=UPI0030ED6DF3
MKRLKTIIQLISITFVMTAFSNCAGSKKLQQEAPFSMGTVYAQKWVAGVKGGGSGINLGVPINNLPKEIVLDSVYFRGMKAPLIEEVTDKGTLYMARFKTDLNKKKDMISHVDPRKEVGNEPPSTPEQIPFELGENEAVISYHHKGKIRYYKVENVKTKASIPFPSAPLKKGF